MNKQIFFFFVGPYFLIFFCYLFCFISIDIKKSSPPHDDYGALLNDHQNQQNAQYYPSNHPSNHCQSQQDIAKKFLFAVEDFLDTVRKLKNDYENGMLLLLLLLLLLSLFITLNPCTFYYL